jgi:uncharacterized membrane protein
MPVGLLLWVGQRMMESHYRSIVKTLTWRVLATAITFSVAWILLGKLGKAVEIGILDTLIKLGAYYSHERVWNRLQFGKPKPPEYQI